MCIILMYNITIPFFLPHILLSWYSFSFSNVSVNSFSFSCSVKLCVVILCCNASISVLLTLSTSSLVGTSIKQYYNNNVMGTIIYLCYDQ